MGSMVLYLHIKFQLIRENILKFIVAFINKQKFVFYIMSNDLFFKGSGMDAIKVLNKYLSLSWQSRNKYMSITKRNVQDSYSLFCALAETYLETHSEVTLHQLLEVFKIEIIEREKHGGKQF